MASDPAKKRAKDRRYYLSHKEKWQARLKLRTPEERRAEYRRNRAKYITRAATWAAAHPQAVRESKRKYDKANPLVRCAIQARRRARLANVEATLTIEQWQDIKALYGNCCAYCREQKPLEMDHVTAIAAGGAHTAENIVPACRSCNASKGKRHVDRPIAP